MARLVGVPHFLTEASCDEEKDDNSAFRRAKRNDDDGQSLRITQVAAVKRMQKQFLGHILRRTVNSKDWKEEPLVKLPPYKEIIGVLTLTERETIIIQERAEAARARCVECLPVEIHSHSFFSVVTANETGQLQTRVSHECLSFIVVLTVRHRNFTTSTELRYPTHRKILTRPFLALLRSKIGSWSSPPRWMSVPKSASTTCLVMTSQTWNL